MSAPQHSDDALPRVSIESQVLYRRVNERILELARSSRSSGELFVCECGRAECSQPLVLTPAEYEEIRGDATHFVLMPGHEEMPRETVVLRTDRFVVVESSGDGRAIALRTDPRRPPHR